MTQNITGLGAKAAEFLITFSAQGKSIFSVKDARSFWGNPAYTTNMLNHLESKGWLRRLERGTYMILPLEAGLDRTWSESGYAAAPHLIQPAAVAYWSALHYWEMSEQIPHTVFVQSTNRKHQNKKMVLGIPFQFVTVVESKFFNNVNRTIGGKSFPITSREKTLVDALDRPDLCGGIAQLAPELKGNWSRLDWNEVDKILEKWPTKTPYKRIGYMVEVMDIPIPDQKTRLKKWQQSLSAGVSLLEPGRTRKTGPITTRWNLRINLEHELQK